MAQMDEIDAAIELPPGAPRCRVCGCTDANACVDPEHGPCWWVEPDLCSHCGEPAIVAAEYDRLQAELGRYAGAGALLEAYIGWSRKARVALERAATTPADSFDP